MTKNEKLLSKLTYFALQNAAEYFLQYEDINNVSVKKWVDKDFMSIDIFSDTQRMHTYYASKKDLKHDYKILKKIFKEDTRN